jgi:5-formyltetrahydrofolate cyclo-ligase
MTKKELRRIYLKKRMEMSEAEFRQLNEQLCARFFESIDLSSVDVLHTFLPIEKNREVNTLLIIDRLTQQFPGIRISVPKINNQTAALEHYYFEGKEQLKNNTWEIPEPVKGVPTPIEKIDAVLVPLLAFDKLGNRLGYGRGFYDRFLAECRPDCLKIGLSFFETEEKIDGMGETDVPLNVIITPQNKVVI